MEVGGIDESGAVGEFGHFSQFFDGEGHLQRTPAANQTYLLHSTAS